MSAGWLREDQPDVAIQKILEAAEKAFIEHGVSGAGMGKIAEAAGCSRGTLYRYFPNRHDLHVAFVDRAALRIVERVREQARRQAEPSPDPTKRLTEFLLASVGEVRRDPATAAWFTPGTAGAAARMGRSSEVTESLATAFVARLLGMGGEDPDSRLRARWCIRIVISLLVQPGESEAEERALVERFVAPTLVAQPTPRGWQSDED